MAQAKTHLTAQYNTLDEFWPFYVSQHRNAATRRLHFAGTTIGLALAAAAGISGDWRLLGAALLGAYALAWIGHFFFEKNRPATFDYPLLSFRADFRMYRMTLAGKMDAEVERLKAG